MLCNKFNQQIKPQPIRWHYPLINYLIWELVLPNKNTSSKISRLKKKWILNWRSLPIAQVKQLLWLLLMPMSFTTSLDQGKFQSLAKITRNFKTWKFIIKWFTNKRLKETFYALKINKCYIKKNPDVVFPIKQINMFGIQITYQEYMNLGSSQQVFS